MFETSRDGIIFYVILPVNIDVSKYRVPIPVIVYCLIVYIFMLKFTQIVVYSRVKKSMWNSVKCPLVIIV